MCGIAGVITTERGASPDREELWKMARSLRHRGPDALAIHVAGRAGLAHARLSIVDVAGGRQPMTTPDGAHTLVFNGEIFNHVELRAELSALGHRFETRSDTEVLLHAYLEYGPECVHRFNGQWAFALWDARTETLFASRDRAGIRPLYHARTAGAFRFASEVKSLFACAAVPRALDPVGLDQIFTLWATIAPRTVFRGIEELPPGHSLLLRRGELKTWRYWDLDYGDPFTGRTEQDLGEEVRALLVDAIRLRLERSDVPVGSYLSGGLDSTIIAAAQRHYTRSPLRTFSIAFTESEFDESAAQARVVAELGLDHRSLLCRPSEIGRVFPEVVWHSEQPLVRTAPVPMYLLSRLARDNGYKVVLSGEGADELFGGYDLFKEAKIRRFCAAQPRSRLRTRLFRRLYPYMPALQRQSDDYLRAFFQARPQDLGDPFFAHAPRFRVTEKIKLFYSGEMRSELAGVNVHRELAHGLPRAFGEWHPFCRAQYAEFRYLLPGYLLSSQGDRQALAHGVEGRHPFLDYRLMELAARIPPNLKMKVLDEKYLLKRAFADLVPSFLRRRPKQPYRAPGVSSFFDPATGRARFDYVEEALSDEALRQAGVFDPASVGLLLAKARRGQIVGTRDAMSLVALLSTQLVFQQFIRRNGGEPR